MMDPISREMLRQAVSAAKDGDIDTALTLVRDVLKTEPNSAQAWLLLARLVKDDYEKRVALANVLQLDPNNEVAKKLLAQMDATKETAKSDDILPGISRRMVTFLAAGFVLLLAVAFIIISNINRANERERQQELSIRQTELARPTQIVLDVTNDVLTAEQIGTETAVVVFLTISPTPTVTPTSPLPTLPPTSTPTPTITMTPTPIPPPSNLLGSLVGLSGRNPLGDNMPLVQFAIGEDAPVQIGTLEGQTVHIFPDLTRYVFLDYSSDLGVNRINIYDRTTGVSEQLPLLRSDVAFNDPAVVSLSADGNRMLFLAELFTRPGTGLYVYQFDTDTLSQIPLDDAIYSDPVISPDGRRAVAVREVTSGDNAGSDLVLIDLATGVPTSLTTDRNVITETSPRWSADGTFIFYEGKTEAQDDHDIYVISPVNPGAGLVRISSPADEVSPVPDPTGRYLAYASNAGGRYYDVMIFDLTAGITFQQTRDDEGINDFPTDWR